MMTHTDDTGVGAPERNPRAAHCNAIDVGLASLGTPSGAVQTEDCASVDETSLHAAQACVNAAQVFFLERAGRSFVRPVCPSGMQTD
ncbi:hypothetical protein [Primorskyibacter flagellatus]|uniref:hypothetical protein n=1 Tax=Primorskyibacter flagellatus TaxID=1387277 RepID=UPI003A936EFE